MTIKEAVAEVKSKKSAKFTESIEAHFKIRPSKEGKQDLRFLFKMPHLYGSDLAIVALTSKVKTAKKAGAKYAGGEELIAKIAKGKVDFDVIIAEPKMMQFLKPLAKDLGRAGKMPTDKTGTLTEDVVSAIGEITAGRREIRSDEQVGIHLLVGKMDTTDEEIIENIEEIKKVISSHRPIESLSLCSTMGKSIKVDLANTVRTKLELIVF